jgi:20S proteasome alpha/beta subunit
MTIAAGFKYKDGILLCADREITEGASKYSKPKVFGEQIGPEVSLGFSYSGAMDYAVMAIQGIIAVVKSSHLTSHAQIWLAIKDTIHEIYSDSIGRLPEYQQEIFQFSLLIAVWADGQEKLYTAENTAITEEFQYRCIGIGRDLAKYLVTSIGCSGSDRMPLRYAEIISLRILEHVKENVPGCGKEMDVLIMDSNGALTRKTQYDYRFELKMLYAYESMVMLLFPFATDMYIPEEERVLGFRMAAESYQRHVSKMRAERNAELQEDEGEE